MFSSTADDLQQYVGNRKALPLQSDSFTWMLPCDSVYLTRLQFEENVPERVHHKVFSSQDGVSWHLAADSGKCKIEAKTSLSLSRPPYLVKWLESAFQNFELEPVAQARSSGRRLLQQFARFPRDDLRSEPSFTFEQQLPSTCRLKRKVAGT